MKEKRDVLRDGIPDRALIEPGEGGLQRLTVTTPLAHAQVYLHGAHITHFQPIGEAPLLFLSSAASFANDKAIRGGVPVIFPWFGPRGGQTGAPMHGFVRTAPWGLETLECAEDDRLTATFRYAANEATRAQWPHEFELRYRITVGTELRMALEVRNTSDTHFTFEEALHTYLAIGDIRSASVFGLNDVNFIDKTDGGRRKRQQDEALRFTAETDRVYLRTHGACLVKDPVLGREILIEKSGSESTVVWNPWSVKGAAMTDLGKDEWTRMICVETGNAADNAVTLSPGAERTMETVIRVARD